MVDPLTLTSLLIEPYFNDTKLGSATGFIIEKNGKYYLVTNWHVVTGVNPLTNYSLHSKGARPNILQISHHITPFQNSIDWFTIKIPLYKSTEMLDDEKLWIEHIKGNQIDVVLIPIELPKEPIRLKTHVANFLIHKFHLELANTDMIPTPAMQISIIGFPLGRSAGGLLPIWVTGFIASEPYIDIDDLPLLYVIASGLTGLSGAPVVLKLPGGYATSDGKYILGGGYETKFLGVYSGRISKELNVCRVWKPIVIEQILNQIEGNNAMQIAEAQNTPIILGLGT